MLIKTGSEGARKLLDIVDMSEVIIRIYLSAIISQDIKVYLSLAFVRDDVISIYISVFVIRVYLSEFIRLQIRRLLI